jgi:hypothetical protein
MGCIHDLSVARLRAFEQGRQDAEYQEHRPTAKIGQAVRLALLDANGPTGSFSDEDGPIPW